jgi:nitric oxide reductase NorD protein
VAGVLGSFTAGLAGRHLKLQVGDEVFTDTEVIHLPERLTHFQDRPGNYRLYKAMIAHQWAQVWFGTWRVPVVERLQRFPDPARALSLFHALECIRFDACLARELPGLWRGMKRLDDPPRGLAQGPLWREAEHGLGAADVGVERTWAEVERFYLSAGVLPKACYQGVLRPEKVAAVLARRAGAPGDAGGDCRPIGWWSARADWSTADLSGRAPSGRRLAGWARIAVGAGGSAGCARR